MITREFLESIQDLESVLKMKRRELVHLRETLDLKGVSYENIGAAAGSRKTDAIADKICTIVDFEEHIKADEQRLAAMRIEATVAIGMLESNDPVVIPAVRTLPTAATVNTTSHSTPTDLRLTAVGTTAVGVRYEPHISASIRCVYGVWLTDGM